jgi:hypothetical protein
MKTTKHPYITPDVARRRVFLEGTIAASAEVLFSGASAIQQTDWTSVNDEIADAQGDLWVGY